MPVRDYSEEVILWARLWVMILIRLAEVGKPTLALGGAVLGAGVSD